MLQIKQAVRKPFPIQFEQITLDNIEEVAVWCKGTVEKRQQKMLGTTVELPVIRLKGQGDQRNKTFDASLGCYVVELKGSFRVYKPQQFEASFDVVPSTDDLIKMAEDTVASLSQKDDDPQLPLDVAVEKAKAMGLTDAEIVEHIDSAYVSEAEILADKAVESECEV